MEKAAGGDEKSLIALAEAIARQEMIQAKSSGARANRLRPGALSAQCIQEGRKRHRGRRRHAQGQHRPRPLPAPAHGAVRLQTLHTVPGGEVHRDSARNGFQDKIIWYYVNALISGPVTHTRYAIGNMINVIEKPLLEIPAAALSGALREKMGFEPDGDRVYLGRIA